MKDYIKTIGVIFTIGILALSFVACDSKTAETPVYDIEFHRGGRDVRPENTLYSYQYAIEKGAATIECDMHPDIRMAIDM